MYFVTIKRDPYILFCTTPSERAALGLTDKQIVHFLVRKSIADDWVVRHQWNASDYSHTDFMAALHQVTEPDDPERLLDLLPSAVRPRS